MVDDDFETKQLLAVVRENAKSILLARQQAKIDLIESREALRVSEAKLSLGIIIGQLGLCSIDYLTNTITLDETTANLFGLQSTIPLLRSKVHERIHPDDMWAVNAKIKDALDPTGNGYMAIEHRICRPDGSICWVSVQNQVQFAPDVNGVLHAVSGIFFIQDITERRATKENVRVSEARYRTVIEGSIQGIVIQVDGRIVYSNSSMARIFGYNSPNDMIGLSTFDDLVVQEDQPALRKRTAQVYSGEVIGPHPGWRGRHKLGKTLWVSSAAHITEWEMRPAVASFYYDITSEKLANESLRQSEIAYRHALKAARSGAFEWDIADDKVTWSQETGDLLKVTPQDYPTTLEKFLQFVPAEERADMAAGIQRRLASESNDYEIENRLLRGDGSIQWVRGSGAIERDATGKPLRLIGLVSDINELRKTQDALKFSETRLRRTLDNILALVGTLSPDGVLSEVNSTAIEMTGLPRDDFVGKPFWENYWWSYSSDVQRKLELAINSAAAGEAVRYDVAIRVGSAHLITIDFQIAPIFDDSGKVMELVLSGVDITQRKRGEERISLLMREVNHRSKNMLTVVLAIARQTARDTDVKTFVSRLADRISGLAASQDLLVENDWQGAEVAELVEAQLSHFTDLIGRRITLDGLPIRLTPVATQAIGMALHELGTNASKYGALSDDRGKVHISWHTKFETEPTFSISWREIGGPLVGEPKQSGFGQKVIGSMLEAAVFGKVQIDYSKSGLSWNLSAPTSTTLEPSGLSAGEYKNNK